MSTTVDLSAPKVMGAMHGKGSVKVVHESARGSVFATLKGLTITLKYTILNLTGKLAPTVSYPEQRRNYSDRFRGVHVITQRPDGSPKCVACYMCSTICPADCIHIEAGERDGATFEKYPTKFEIDMLRCVMCGLCVDACPEEAIIMSKDYEMAAYTREDTVYDLTRLMFRKGIEEWGLGYRPRRDDIDVASPARHPRDKKPMTPSV